MRRQDRAISVELGAIFDAALLYDETIHGTRKPGQIHTRMPFCIEDASGILNDEFAKDVDARGSVP